MDEQESTESTEVSDEEYTRLAYEQDVKRLSSFEEVPILWPNPIGPHWKN